MSGQAEVPGGAVSAHGAVGGGPDGGGAPVAWPRTGQGVDVHAFDASLDRPLRIGGIEIPGATALAGHSDADVALHALVDALLGAVAAGDIGQLVGVDRADTADADSAGFVALALERVAAAGYVPGTVDLTVVASRPRLSGHREAMRARIAELLGVDVGAISVKATTTDGLGFTGRGEGIACLATAVVHPAARLG